MTSEVSVTATSSVPTPQVDLAAIEEQLLMRSRVEEAARPQQNGEVQEPQETQVLESHEVIELQSFIDRKAWIEEKRKHLEKMPPVEVFIGLEALRSSAEVVPGLPTREELNQWIREHDEIEKDTEIFDSGELTKLRKFTKAAAQRHMSREDTDLIELTLTTIYELDKLLHLLRGRSESLHLLGVRLTWENHRVLSWKERRKVIADLGGFLANSARWSSSVYETLDQAIQLGPPDRRSSIGSVSSDQSMVGSFSRSARFKQAEILSKEAARFGGRVSGLRHGTVDLAGKALDKLIDQSRNPVPDELLDEQDRLEERCINELDTVGSFAMNVATQWRKADEYYVETMRDLGAAQTLIEEIELALLNHPTSRQSIAFSSRSETVVKRLILRGSPSVTVPHPQHPLFPDQLKANQAINLSLTTELSNATQVARKASELSKKYKSSFEAVKVAEEFLETSTQHISLFDDIVSRLQDGVTVGDGDGSPPNLEHESCLDVTRHATFIAFLPSIIEELESLDTKASKLLQGARAITLEIDRPGIDRSFRQNISVAIKSLMDKKGQATLQKDKALLHAQYLKDARRLNSTLSDLLASVRNIQERLDGGLESTIWESGASSSGEANTALEGLPIEARKTVSAIASRLPEEVEGMFTTLSPVLGAPPRNILAGQHEILKESLDKALQTARILERAREQTARMYALQLEFQQHHKRILDLQTQLDLYLRSSLDGHPLTNGTTTLENTTVDHEIAALRQDVDSFTSTLASRVILIATNSPDTSTQSVGQPDGGHRTLHRRSSSSLENVGAIDERVRADCNRFTMTLNGDLKALQVKANYLKLTHLAREVDSSLALLRSTMDQARKGFNDVQASFDECRDHTDSPYLSVLDDFVKDLDSQKKQEQEEFGTRVSEVAEMVDIILAFPNSQDEEVRHVIYISRRESLAACRASQEEWLRDMDALAQQIQAARQAEVERLEKERLAAEEAARLERERILEEERLKEKLRLEAEEERRALEEARRKQAEEDARVKAELQRLAEEEEARAKAQQEREEAELQQRLEEEKKAAEEKARLLAEEELARSAAKAAAIAPDPAALADSQQALLIHRGEASGEGHQSILDTASSSGGRRQGLDVNRPGEVTTPRSSLSGKGSGASDASTRQVKLRSAHASLQRSETQILDEPFTLRVAQPATPRTQELRQLQQAIQLLRKRLRSLSLNELAYPPLNSSRTELPTQSLIQRTTSAFHSISAEAANLKTSDDAVRLELDSLRFDLLSSERLIAQLELLGKLGKLIEACDEALSDLLDHIDSFPEQPAATSMSLGIPQAQRSPEELLKSRLNEIKPLILSMQTQYKGLAEDQRASAEIDRVLQVWNELKDMAEDKINGLRSRSPSVRSPLPPISGRSSRSSVTSTSSRSSMAPPPTKTKKGYFGLSSRPSRPSAGSLKPDTSSSRRAVSGSNTARPPSVMSGAPGRSVSGPFAQLFSSSRPAPRPPSSMSTNSNRSTSTSGSLYSSTFASRQRTYSSSSSISTPTKKTPTAATQPVESPTTPRIGPRASISSISSTFSRAPRLSTSSVRGTPSRRHPPLPKKKAYVANPKNKLDVAVGDVVNKLPVNINIEVVADTWKDQSGKYWIGDQDPKLCFCRILRSKTVMVRVGGGWCELSKFIQGHFADLFRLLPDSSPSMGSTEEKWISSATFLESNEDGELPPYPPRTPEPRFSPRSYGSPKSSSPRSNLSTPSKSGSPLTPLQFLRRAEGDIIPVLPSTLRPVTPSNPPSFHSQPRTSLGGVPGTPSRHSHSQWRP